jgi:hypothetical protein
MNWWEDSLMATPGVNPKQAYINKMAESLIIEGQERLSLEDAKKMEKWLTVNGQIIPDLPVEYLVEAEKLIHHHDEENNFKANLIQTQSIILSFVSLGLALCIIVLLAFFQISINFNNLESLLAVAFFGALGGSISGIYSYKTIDWKNNEERPVQILNKYLTLTKPLVGAAAAIVVLVFVSTGFINLETTEAYQYLAIAFVSGFSERLITGAVGKIVVK